MRILNIQTAQVLSMESHWVSHRFVYITVKPVQAKTSIIIATCHPVFTPQRFLSLLIQVIERVFFIRKSGLGKI